jgi:hypothetical protein
MDYTSRCNLREIAGENQVCCGFLENGNSFVHIQLGLASLPVIYSGNGLQLLKRTEKEGGVFIDMAKYPSNRGSESFMEFALMIILLAIVMLAILLIVGDSVREFFNDIGIRWSLFGSQGAWAPGRFPWIA